MSAKRRKTPFLCFDRTPIFLGVVIIPLAATYAFASSGLMLRSFETHHRGQPTELRVALSDRERHQEELSQFAEGSEDESNTAARLHSPSPVAFADSIASQDFPRSPRVCYFSQEFSRDSYSRPNSLRGPPREG